MKKQKTLRQFQLPKTKESSGNLADISKKLELNKSAAISMSEIEIENQSDKKVEI